MQNVILTIHIIACVTLIGVILLQRSEGGALGMGGGGAGGGLMSARGAAGALVRTTMIFATIFFLTTLTLTTMANRGRETTTVIGDENSTSRPGDIRDDADIPLFDDVTSDEMDDLSSTDFEEAQPDASPEDTVDPLEEQTPVDNAPQ